MSDETRVLPAIEMNQDVTKAIQDATSPEAIRAAIFAEAERQTAATQDAVNTKAAADKVAADKVIADAAAASASAGFSRVEVIGGKEFTFEAETELEIERMVSNALKVAYAFQSTEPVVAAADPSVKVAADKAAADAAVADAAARADLDLQFKSGTISAADYIQRSGAVKDYLAKEGISVDALKRTVETTQDAAEAQSWGQAVETFLNTPAGADWPGGDKNLNLIGLQIQAMNLSDAPDKVAALAKAYNKMKELDIVFPFQSAETNANAAAVKAAADAAAAKIAQDAAKVAADAAVATIRTEVAARAAASSSSLFGRSSGVGATITPGAAGTEKTVEVPSTATPQEIMEAWKTAQLAAGKSPDAVFLDTFRAHRA